MAEIEEELKSLLMRVKEESEKVCLKLNIKKKTKIRSFGPIILCQIEGERVEAEDRFPLPALKSLCMVTAIMKLEDDFFLAGKL